VVRASEQPVVRSTETAQVGRLLTASHRRGTFELYAMDIGPEPRNADPHHPGVIEHLLVVEGALRVGPASGPVELESGDLVTFPADVAHLYQGLPSAHYALLMSYP
jgi:quercetin dioxygenase-like cupin family protein